MKKKKTIRKVDFLPEMWDYEQKNTCFLLFILLNEKSVHTIAVVQCMIVYIMVHMQMLFRFWLHFFFSSPIAEAGQL